MKTETKKNEKWKIKCILFLTQIKVNENNSYKNQQTEIERPEHEVIIIIHIA